MERRLESGAEEALRWGGLGKASMTLVEGDSSLSVHVRK